jgi:hypothetical protein
MAAINPESSARRAVAVLTKTYFQSQQSNRYQARNKTEITSKRNTCPFFIGFAVLNGSFVQTDRRNGN